MRLRTRVTAAAAVVAAGCLSFGADAADAGGGCHRDASPAQGTGTVVELGKNCMSPSVLRTEPGSTVTFVNRDPYEHNVFGERWGFDDIDPGESVAHRFLTAGTYAFTCSLHPGMVGAVVVGDGVGAGTVVDLRDVAPAAKSDTDSDTATRSGMWLGLAVGSAGGAAAASVASRLVRRRRQPAG